MSLQKLGRKPKSDRKCQSKPASIDSPKPRFIPTPYDPNIDGGLEPPVEAEREVQDGVPGDLPGKNPYDNLLGNKVRSFKEAKEREELKAIMGDKAAQLKIATQAAQLAYDKERLDLDVKRGELITKTEQEAMLSVLVSSFRELLRLSIYECALRLPATEREVAVERVTTGSHNALSALGAAIMEKKSLADANAAMQEAFRGDE